jgi:hypothetical protein
MVPPDSEAQASAAPSARLGTTAAPQAAAAMPAKPPQKSRREKLAWFTGTPKHRILGCGS